MSKSPALTLSGLRCRGEGASAKLVRLCVRTMCGCAYPVKGRHIYMSGMCAPHEIPLGTPRWVSQQVQSEPKMTIGYEHTTVATSTQHQPRKPQASNLLIR